MSFFTNEAFLKAKEVLHSELAISSRLIKCQKDDDNTLNLYQWFATAAKKKQFIPIFVIYSPSEIPVIGDAVAASLVSQVNKINRKN